jgi:hypothetical protein
VVHNVETSFLEGICRCNQANSGSYNKTLSAMENLTYRQAVNAMINYITRKGRV